MEFEKLYMFNPFVIASADNQKIADTYSKLQSEIVQDADTCFLISRNKEKNFIISKTDYKL